MCSRISWTQMGQQPTRPTNACRASTQIDMIGIHDRGYRNPPSQPSRPSVHLSRFMMAHSGKGVQKPVLMGGRHRKIVPGLAQGNYSRCSSIKLSQSNIIKYFFSKLLQAKSYILLATSKLTHWLPDFSGTFLTVFNIVFWIDLCSLLYCSLQRDPWLFGEASPSQTFPIKRLRNASNRGIRKERTRRKTDRKKH